MEKFAYREYYWDDEGNVIGFKNVYKTLAYPTKGTAGNKGGDGFIVVYWDKEE